MVAFAQHGGYLRAAELRGPRVLRRPEDALVKGVAGHRLPIAHDAGQHPAEGLDEDQRRQLAAVQHVVADADLIGDQGAAHAFVHALVPGTDDDQTLFGGQVADQVLVQRPRRLSTAANKGSHFITMPGPPP